MIIYKETPRFILREIIPEDIEGFYELDSDPEVHRYLGNKPVQSKNQLLIVIQNIRKQYVENGIGRWAIIDKSTNDFIGWTGLKLVKELTNNHIDYYDLGYRLIRKYWGQGIATECAIASLDYGFNELNLNEIYAAAHIENQASLNVLTKMGFKIIENFQYDGSEHHWLMLQKQNWK